MEKEKLQRYSIRKLSVGAASVLIGIGFAGMGANQVNAATVNGNQQIVESEKTKDATQQTDSQITTSQQDKTPASLSDAANDQSSGSQSTAKTLEHNSTQVDKNVSQSPVAVKNGGGVQPS